MTLILTFNFWIKDVTVEAVLVEVTQWRHRSAKAAKRFLPEQVALTELQLQGASLEVHVDFAQFLQTPIGPSTHEHRGSHHQVVQTGEERETLGVNQRPTSNSFKATILIQVYYVRGTIKWHEQGNWSKEFQLSSFNYPQKKLRISFFRIVEANLTSKKKKKQTRRYFFFFFLSSPPVSFFSH